MTDETREKIDEYFRNEDRLSELCDLSPFDAAVYGATHQHPVAFEAGKIEGARIALEEVERIIERKIATKEMWDLNEKGKCMVGGMESAMQTIFTKLEKLR